MSFEGIRLNICIVFKVMRNLHVVFTMNPSANGLRDRASTSPALFNRCVLDWLGDWTLDAYYHVANELTHNVDMQKSDVILFQLIFYPIM